MAAMRKYPGKQQMRRTSNEVKLSRAGACDNGENTNSELKNLIDSCPGVKQRIILENPGHLLARLFFSSPEDAVEGFAFLWKQRLSGVHSWSPEICSGSGDVQRKAQERTRDAFLHYLEELRHGEVVSKCKKEIDEVDKEYGKCIRLLRLRNRVYEWHRLDGLKQGLDAQGKILRKKFLEFKRALQCLETYLKNPIQDYDYFDSSGEERPVFVLGNDWKWEQLQCKIVRECRRFESSLPMYSSRRDILTQVHMKQVMVLIGETGSGKSTQIVQFLADSGFALKGAVVCTQPRRVATMSLAARVAGECKGCYQDTHPVSCFTTNPRDNSLAKITYMTDHALLQLCMSDPELEHVSCIIVDEAHERSLSTDLLLALLKRCLLKRAELRLIIMSATADAKTLSDYFFGCQTLYVPGRNFPVDVKYVANDEVELAQSSTIKYGQLSVPSYVTQVMKIVAEIHAKEEEGAILAFLTSQMEVEWARDQFQNSSAITLALHGKLSIEEQNCVFESAPLGKRKVIFATNVAETSLTIPGVKFVVDSGMVKESRFDPKTGMNVLSVCRITQSEAAQRCGRAGRTQPGVCYRLYTEEEFKAIAPHKDPEILRVHVGIAILKLLALGVKDLQSFDFVQAPSQEAIDMAVKNLFQLGAVVFSQGYLKLTDFGWKLVKLGVEPRLGKIILDCFNQRLGREGLVLAAVMANAGSIFCRVGTEADKSKSDCLKLRFCNQYGDLFTLLAVYKEWEDEPPGKRNIWCWDNSINAKSMLRCRDTIAEMEVCLKNELNIIVPSYWSWSPLASNKHSIALRKVILSSMVENLGMFSGYDRLGYDIASTGQQAHLHPSCSLLAFGNKPTWVVFSELLCTTRKFLVCVTVVEEEWVSAIQPPPSYNVFQLKKIALEKKVISGLGRCLLKRFSGKANCNLHALVHRIQQTCNSHRGGIEVDHDNQEIQLFSVAEEMEQAYGLLENVLKCERRWMLNECMEMPLFYACSGKYSPAALFGAGAEIKHLELEGKYLSVEVSCPNVHLLDDREVILLFENCTDGIAGFHKFSGIGQETTGTGKWGIITFLTSKSAEAAVCKSKSLKLGGSCLTVCPFNASPVTDHKRPGFPAVKAMIMWPRRQSKGVAIIICADEDVDRIAFTCSEMIIGRSRVRCRRGKMNGTVFMTNLDTEFTENELRQVLGSVTNRKIVDLYIIRHPAGIQPSDAKCEAALLQELTKFVPRDKCQVLVFKSDPKHISTRALVTFDGSIHLRAAMALSHLQGKFLSVCMPWQKITCEQTFCSTILCPAPIYSVLKMELNSLIESFQDKIPGLKIDMSKTERGSYRIKILSNTMEAVAKCRFSLEGLLEGVVVTDDRLDPAAMQLLFTQEGVQLLRYSEQKTKTYIFFEKRSLSIKIFGPPDKYEKAVTVVIDGLMRLLENSYHDIPIRGEGFPYGLMKEVVKRFGVDLCGLKEIIPEADFILNTRHHVLSVRGSREAKCKAQHVITETANSLKCVAEKMLKNVEERENACPICLCEIEDSYRLERCGHAFCRSCLVDQCYSAMKSHEGFPLVCACENCDALLIISDLRSLLSIEQLDELFQASLGAFVASSKGRYRFCTTPDCPAVYEVSSSGKLFVCGNCSVELCTTCHLEYHPYISCEKYREFKQDPDASLKEWCNGKVDVKRCPVCGFTIEKSDGCNHVNCKCGKHICWVCLECFDSSEICYSHMRAAHGSIN
ncbi:ATP-dependent RNA helicase DEAH12, chloroplastic [Cryptomeria japonica]|uniref:ATP-dependent RNA helicase DEAH12, chloroplastic n=1 Tax=Cryptomeria japonica TaxID=3369 RepID=UPI0027DAB4C9|nr:ATP-dependent RNA helicase DEAH12, chloroplastic [Cryptomeria japonica]